MLAFTARSHDAQALTHVFRFGIVPLFLFSGTFFPIERSRLARADSRLIPLWHGVELIRMAVLGWETAWSPWAHVGRLVTFLVAGSALAVRLLERRLKP
jgi:lipooligosaccharide transport system permease protein